MQFSNNEIADYYNQTLIHYSKWWKLKTVQSLHYGIWENDTKTFAQALANTNKTLSKVAQIKSNHAVLDAGCGVGGAAFYLAKTIGCKVTGITLSQKHLNFANELLQKTNLQSLINFDNQDFCKTNFANNSFDFVWACESCCHANNKTTFINELQRVLKPGGKFIMADYILTNNGKMDKNNYIKNWGNTWAISTFNSNENLLHPLVKKGFIIEKNIDVTKKIIPSSKKMFKASLLGAIPSILYNLTHNTSRFAKKHYQSGYYQYKALKNKLWTYNIIIATKQ